MKTLARILGGLLSFFGINIVQTYPSGITKDKSANFGLMGMWANLNLYSTRAIEVVTTAGTNSLLTATQSHRSVLRFDSGASGGFTITLPATADIIAILGPTIPTDGTFSKIVLMKNNGVGQTGTLTAGDGSTTLTGTMTIATNTTRIFLLTVLSGTTISYENLGSVSL